MFSAERMEKLDKGCKHNKETDIALIYRRDMIDVLCEFILDYGLCSKTNLKCIYYKNYDAEKEEKRRELERIGSPWVKYFSEKMGDDKWYKLKPEERDAFKKQFIEEMRKSGWTERDICLLREWLKIYE